jgi:hypothetical protein
MELEDIEIDLSILREIHGAQTINNLTIVQLRILQKDIEKGKGAGSNSGPGYSALGSMGIETNSPKAQNKTLGEGGNLTTKSWKKHEHLR